MDMVSVGEGLGGDPTGDMLIEEVTTLTALLQNKRDRWAVVLGIVLDPDQGLVALDGLTNIPPAVLLSVADIFETLAKEIKSGALPRK